MTSEIIYRHPKGRFAVRRVTFPPGPLGSAARSYCETVWTPEDDVRGLCPPLPAQGVKRKEIARRLDRTVSAIYNEITREEQR